MLSVPMLTVDERSARAKSRITAIRLALLTLRSMEYWRQGVRDYDSAMVLVAVAAITSERLTRAGLTEEYEDLANPLPTERLGRCNVSSIAAATGLNRETARRKVAGLVAAGLLARTGRSAIGFPPGLLQDSATAELVRRQLDSLVRTANDLIRDGVVAQG